MSQIGRCKKLAGVIFRLRCRAARPMPRQSSRSLSASSTGLEKIRRMSAKNTSKMKPGQRQMSRQHQKSGPLPPDENAVELAEQDLSRVSGGRTIHDHGGHGS